MDFLLKSYRRYITYKYIYIKNGLKKKKYAGPSINAYTFVRYSSVPTGFIWDKAAGRPDCEEPKGNGDPVSTFFAPPRHPCPVLYLVRVYYVFGNFTVLSALVSFWRCPDG